MTKNELREAARVFGERDSFLVLGHINPDGDSLGCMTAFRLAAQSLRKTVTMVMPDGVPEIYRFLPGISEALTEIPAGKQYDVGVIMDCDGAGRLGPLADSLGCCGTTIEIDHHPTEARVSDIRLIDPTSASSGEILYDLLVEAGVRISAEIAECLLTAVVTDTGCFRFTNVRPSTLRAAAGLVECGASVNRIVHRVYETRSVSATKLLGDALTSLTTTSDGRIVYAWITRDQMIAAHADEGETDGIVNFVRSVKGARMGMLFRESSDGTIRVSLRSADKLDVSQIARLFGGGGHKTAAGCVLSCTLSEAIETVVGAAQKWMAY